MLPWLWQPSASPRQKEGSANNQKFFASFEQAGNGKVSLDADLNMYRENNVNSSIIAILTYDEGGVIDKKTPIPPSSISADGKTAVLEYYGGWGCTPFPQDIQGPF